MISLLDAGLSLIDFLPESIASDPDIIALSLAIDPELRSVGAAIIEAVILPRIPQLGDDILDELAWACRFNELQIWDVATTAQKRTLLANLFEVRKKSGTRFSITRAFGLMSVVGQVYEWWEEAAAPYTWRLRLFASGAALTLSQFVQIGELVRRFAPTRAKLSEFAAESDSTAQVLTYSAVTIGRQTEIAFGGP